MKPLAPAEYAALQFAKSDATLPAEVIDGFRDELNAGIQSGLIVSWKYETATKYGTTWRPTESGHRALRVHAAYLATTGGGL